MYSDLLHDLKSIAATTGQMSFTTPAATAIKAWIKGGCKPEPEHKRLQFYNARRIAHLLKLCMISSMSHSCDKIIAIEHYSEALNWLMEAETYMPDIFKSMTTGGDSAAMEEAWNWTWNIYAKDKRPVPEHRIVHFLRERVPAHTISKVIEIMVKSRMLKVSLSDKGFNGYIPTSRQAQAEGDEA